jgi:proprotein convertase subtilisin/kexin type 5
LSGVLYQNRCIGSCPISTYASNGTCLNCSSLCFSCATTASNCTSCSLGTYLYMNQCLSSCPLGYYNENVLLICEQCNAKCSNCTNYTYCLTCLEGYLDSTNNCVDSCSLGFYAQLSDRTCRLCDLTCSSCSNISTNCITCATGYVLVQLTLSSSMCSTSCSSTEYSINGICYACSSPCLQCTSSTNCVSCVPSFSNQANRVCQSVHCRHTKVMGFVFRVLPHAVAVLT